MQSDNSTKSEDSDAAKANLLDNVENGIWHAFDFLAHEEDATAPKTKLKVRIPLFRSFSWLLDIF